MNISPVSLFIRSMLVAIPIAIAASLVLGITYINDQQTLRLGANEPQEWLSADAEVKIAGGESIQQVLMTPSLFATTSAVEISTDSSPYIVICDQSGNPIGGNGYLHGVLATLPQGVLASSTQDHRGFVTWQPEEGVREALVIDHINSPTGGYVVSGRSLAYVENEEDMLTARTFVGWIGCMIAIFIACLASVIFFSRFNSYPHSSRRR